MIDLARELIYHTATDERCEQSANERALVARIQALGVPAVPQVKFGDNWVADALINGTTLILECHGAYWHTRPEVRDRDERKLAWARANGYRVVTVWEDAYLRDPEAEVLRVLGEYETYQAVAAAVTATYVRLAAAQEAADKHGKHAGDRPRRSDYGDWRDAFLDALSGDGILLDGCEAAGVTYETVRRHRREDPAFNVAVKDARKAAADRLRRTYQGRAKLQSDRAMEFLLKALDPEEYSDAMATVLQALLQYVDMAKLSNEQIDRLAAGDDPIRVLLNG